MDAQQLKKGLAELKISKLNEETYVRSFLIKGLAVVLSNGKKIEPNTDGNLFLSEEDFQHMNTFQVFYKDALIPAADCQYLRAEHKLLFETTIQAFLAKKAGMSEETEVNCHSKEGKGIRTSGTRKEMGRCMDYNGKWSDGGNYRITDPRSARNFTDSDCDKAMWRGYC